MVQGASGASVVHFGKNFFKQKLQTTPELLVASHLFGPQIQIWKDPGPMSFMVTHMEGQFVKSKLLFMFLVATWLGWTPYTLTLGFQKGLKGAWWGSLASVVNFGRNFIKQTCRVGQSQLFWTPNPNLEGYGSCVLLRPGS